MRQHADFIARKILVLVMLVPDDRNARKMLHGGKQRIVNHDGSVNDVPGMFVKARRSFRRIPATRKTPSSPCARRRNAVLFDEGHRSAFCWSLSSISRNPKKRSRRSNSDFWRCWTAAQHNRLFRDELRIGADVGVVQTRFAAQRFNRRQRVRDGIVLEAVTHVAHANTCLRVGRCGGNG